MKKIKSVLLTMMYSIGILIFMFLPEMIVYGLYSIIEPDTGTARVLFWGLFGSSGFAFSVCTFITGCVILNSLYKEIKIEFKKGN